ncbi:hypothetical protein Nepgr_025611 [Nepenthes gracilis]|uniref:J domain-containing protein required for chloroplast accumulation response 1 n=1 Tax=Nepenthes gracilis TaxID=150966 RepID=A0AAD3T6N5_NEPGR|nr:hypothetical protein Nepgr_025611 [Nepenthes gracilis]
MRISQRDKVQLGCSSTRISFQNPNSPERIPNRESDIDFSDVFGGPPRKSINEIRQGFCREITGNSCAIDEDREPQISGNPLFRYGEKPVFGEEIVNRSRYTSEDFYDDIFRGDQSVSSSPRLPARNPFSSSPGSRILSPVWPLPGAVNPFGTLAPFSLPARLSSADLLSAASVKGSLYRTDEGATGQTYSSSNCMSRFSRQTIRDVLRADVCSTSFQSKLSDEFYVSGARPVEDPKLDGVEAGLPDKDFKRSEFPNDGGRFHFSIHKWASKGVPLVMSLWKTSSSSSKSKEKSRMERSLSSNGRVENDIWASETHTAEMSNDSPSAKSEMSTSSGVKYEKQGDGFIVHSSTEETTTTRQTVGGSFPAVPNYVPIDSFHTSDVEVPRIVNYNSTEKEREVLTNCMKKPWPEAEKEVSELTVDVVDFNLEPLCSMSHNIEEKKGNNKIITEDGGKLSMVETKEHKSLNADSVLGCEEVEMFTLQHSLQAPGKNEGKAGVAGKVKQFAKIFNQGSLPKSVMNVDAHNLSCRWTDRGSFKLESEAKVISKEKLREKPLPDIRRKKTCLDTPRTVNGTHTSRKLQSDANHVHKISELSSAQEDNLASCSESTFGGFEASLLDIDITCPEEILIKELSEGPEKPSESGDHLEEIKVIESKIVQWSKGKEGNIRALLSTLQYVLWPNSGWKPVPLVDIIEANAVKRAYQKALLCLHPDKLQQKGASSHQKYIAEKVFDILQEAWDHFNLLGSL